MDFEIIRLATLQSSAKWFWINDYISTISSQITKCCQKYFFIFPTFTTSTGHHINFTVNTNSLSAWQLWFMTLLTRNPADQRLESCFLVCGANWVIGIPLGAHCFDYFQMEPPTPPPWHDIRSGACGGYGFKRARSQEMKDSFAQDMFNKILHVCFWWLGD